MPRTSLYALVLILGLPALARAQAPCTVAHVIDGDTFNCRDGRNVRLLGIDSPDAGQFGNVARRALATLLPVGSAVRIETDSIPRDSDGRLLAYVFLEDGRLVNELLVREGFAFYRSSRENTRYATRLRAAEQTARGVSRGVWSQ